MPKPFVRWTVLEHEALNPVDQDILSAVGKIHMPVGDLPRRMTVVRLRDGRLVIYSALALDEYEMASLENFGRPAFLVVPNDHHRLDAKPWKDRYPDIQVVTPEGARAQVEKAVHVDATSADFNDPDVKLVVVPGTSAHEAALEVSRPSGTTLVLNDIVSNIRTPPGFGGWLLALMGFAGDEPHVPLPVKFAIVDDRRALAAQMRRWAELPMLKRVLVSHGAAIEKDPRGALRALADSLE
jgi:hypothetical protein